MKKLLLLLSFLITANVNAKAIPAQYGVDNRIQYFNYTPDDVFLIKAKIGYSNMIQLEDGEVLTDDSALSMGIGKDWSVGVKANNILFKPKHDFQRTNMLLVTNKRTYVFEIEPSNIDSSSYITRFIYPKKSKIQQEENKIPTFLRRINKDDNLYIDSRINIHYFKKGDNSLSPSNVWDNNLFTYLKYNNSNDLPTVYKVLNDGAEVLVNTHIEGDTLVVHEVAKTLRLRLSKSVLDLHNANIQPTTFNTSNTSEDGLNRVSK